MVFAFRFGGRIAASGGVRQSAPVQARALFRRRSNRMVAKRAIMMRSASIKSGCPQSGFSDVVTVRSRKPLCGSRIHTLHHG